MNTVIQRKNKTFIDFGEKILVLSPHATEVIESSSGKLKKVQKMMKERVALHFGYQLVEALARLRRKIDPSIADHLRDVDEDFQKDMESLFSEALVIGGQAGLNKVHSMQKQAAGFVMDMAIRSYVSNVVGKMIVGADTYTVAGVRDIVGSGMAEGMTSSQIGSLLGDKFQGWQSSVYPRQSRADMIARTEVARANNYGTLYGYEQSGVVTHVEVMDNEGPRSCLACTEANGQTWTIEYSRDHELGHPNCVRAFSPVVGGDPLEGRQYVDDTSREWFSDAHKDYQSRLDKYWGSNADYDKLPDAVKARIDATVSSYRPTINIAASSARAKTMEFIPAKFTKRHWSAGCNFLQDQIEKKIGNPIYASFTRSQKALNQYGNVVVRLKSEVLARATMTPMDTGQMTVMWKADRITTYVDISRLHGQIPASVYEQALRNRIANEYASRFPGAIPARVNSARFTSSLNSVIEKWQYPEIQIYGGITKGDIEIVVINSRGKDALALASRLEREGIPYTIKG